MTSINLIFRIVNSFIAIALLVEHPQASAVWHYTSTVMLFPIYYDMKKKKRKTLQCVNMIFQFQIFILFKISMLLLES